MAKTYANPFSNKSKAAVSTIVVAPSGDHPVRYKCPVEKHTIQIYVLDNTNQRKGVKPYSLAPACQSPIQECLS